jgi:GNAT superfamily N-acetyltransferase
VSGPEAPGPTRRRGGRGREVRPLTLDRLADLPEPCATCGFWETSGARIAGTPAVETKRAWLGATALDWGAPGRVCYVDGQPAGYLTFAPAGFVPRGLAFPTSPVASDALVLLTARVRPEYAGQGLGRMLVQTAAKDALRRGHRALEAFATTSGTGCLLPADFLAAVGFATVRDHPAYPRMRLDLGGTRSWLTEMETAVERLLAPVRDFGRGRPVGSAPREVSQPDRP